jgi:FkbM family methyltransferase
MIKEKYSGEAIDELISFFKLKVKGILHVGAHKCEELEVYSKYTTEDNIYWVEAIKDLVDQNLEKNPNLNLINEVIGDEDGKDIEFKITNNTLSSSILELGEHKNLHPNVVVSKIIKAKTKTLKTILSENKLEDKFNLLVLDLQGAEMLALKGLDNLLSNFEVVYTEVNEKEIYKECCILEDLDVYLSKFGFERKYLNTLNSYGNALYIRKH